MSKVFVIGTSSLVSWCPTAEGTVSLKLFAGASGDMRYVSTVAHFIDNKGTFAWKPSTALDEGEDYALLIVSDADDQLVDCSPSFTIKRPIVNREASGFFTHTSFTQSFSIYDITPTTSVIGSISAAATPTPPSVSITDLPQCALTPTITAIGLTGCGTDIGCVCKSSNFFAQLAPEFQAACSPSDYQEAVSVVVQLCGEVGVSITLPNTGSSTSSTAFRTLSILASPTLTNTMATIAFSSSATTTVASSIAPMVYVPTSSATPPQAAGQTSSSGGLSTGAAIGIGVGATLLVLLLVALLAFFLLRQRHRRRRQEQEQPLPPDLTYSSPAELETSESAPQEATELGSSSGWVAGGKSELESGIIETPMAQMSSPPPLSSEEYAELERRRRAVELQDQSMRQARAAELQVQANLRAELEALRANARAVHELGGQDILPEAHPIHQR